MPISLEDHDYIRLSENPALKISENPSISCGVSEKNNNGLNMKATELRLGLPGSESPKRENNVLDNVVLKGLSSGSKRGFSDTINGGSGKWGLSVGVGSEDGLSVDVQQSPKVVQEKKPLTSSVNGHGEKAQVVGWPPIRSFRKNSMATNPPTKSDEDNDTKSEQGCLYVKVSMDGAPYLRKIDLNTYHSYKDLSSALEKMFSSFTIGQCGTQGGLSKNGLKDIIHGSEYVLTFEDKDGDWMLVGDLPWEMFTDTCKKLRIMKSSDAIGLAPRAMEKSKSRN